MRERPAELRADFQEVYNLNIDGMGTEFTALHAADLASMLPRGSRVWIAGGEFDGWTDEMLILNLVEFRLRAIEYSLAGGKGKKPKPLYQPGKKKTKGGSVAVDKISDYLNRPRSEDGN